MKYCVCSCLYSSDSASSVSSQSDTQWSKAEMADAIRIKEVIQQTGMYFA